ncbi:MAG TPA: hypothetical protein VGN09_26520 [Vicinamibacteria bacterium]
MLFGSFAAISLLLASVGVYLVVAFGVTRRRAGAGGAAGDRAGRRPAVTLRAE